MKAWPLLGLVLIQSLLLAAHWFLFHTWIAFWSAPGAATVLAVRAVVLVLAFSFVFASLLSFRFSNPLVDFFYRCAAIWLGFLNYLFFAACLSWLVWYAVVALQLGFNPAVVRPFIFVALSAAGVLAGVFGVINRRWIRVREVTVALAGLPESWRGRRAVLMSDLHLGNINRVAFSRRIVEMTARLKPDIVFIPGDLYDGGEANLDALVEPFSKLNAPLGIYFSSGNHEEFGGVEEKLGAISRAGIEILHNRKVTVDGLHIAGVPYGDSTSPIRLRATLERLALTPGEASILLNHMPSRLPIVERAGISLQLSGHTHGGQLFPFTWFTRRAFGRFTYGLQSFGSLQVYTSYGAGTWGPPMRLGTHSEIVLLQFE